MNLSERIKDTMSRAELNPRVLGGLTKIHYTTIYNLLRTKDASPTPVVAETLNRCLSAIDRLIELQKLPLSGTYTTEQKIPMVEELLATL